MSSAASPFDLLAHAIERGEPVAQATLLAGPRTVGARRLLFADGRAEGTLGDAALDSEADEAARGLMAAGRAAARRVRVELSGTPADLFVEYFPPPPHLILFGGVHIAIPLAHFAKALGFRVTLADPRERFANAERFPMVDRIIAAWPDEAMMQLAIGPETYCVILTHDPKIDEPALRSVLGRGAAYVGAIGSRVTHAERFERMARQGVGAEALAEVYAPIGLDLGAQSPEEIALAILAEIVAVRRGGRGGFLRDDGWGRE